MASKPDLDLFETALSHRQSASTLQLLEGGMDLWLAQMECLGNGTDVERVRGTGLGVVRVEGPGGEVATDELWGW